MMMQPATTPSPIPTPARGAGASQDERGALSSEELFRLTLFKWRYSLEACGFAPHEVPHLVFLKWLRTSQRL